MKVFKFGGASVKDANAVRNVAEIVKRFPGEDLLVIVSAMGKMTNALERLTDAFYFKKEDAGKVLEEIRGFHLAILNDLFPSKEHPIHTEIHNTFVELEWAIDDEPTHSYDCEYDQIVSMGEIISTKIVHAFLKESGVKSEWMDARDVIKTDNTYREGKVEWELTEEMVHEKFDKLFTGKGNVIVTQGFIGVTSENFTTTLGREGSDYTAAILAYCLGAESVTIWKDVPGVLNADPKWFDETKLIPQLTYQDAIELTYYGATVIHPKTIKPLQNKNIPLYVRSFIDPVKEGTRIHQAQMHLPVPCFIFKVNQVLLSISPKDFSFIVEENLGEIFEMFAEHRVKMNVMLNSAISFSVSVDNDERKLPALIAKLREKFRVLYNENVELVTIRYYDQATIDRVTAGKQIFLEVKSRYTVQIVMKDNA
ncbi:MAG TPA: aspartate kinase [Bacteroidia bacterium]|jgi:aspartate kinase|nr:aspartate kinase [Bacteroidia bacterium]